MQRLPHVSAFLVLIAAPALLQTRAAGQTANPNQTLLNSYCLGCHNSRAKIGGLALDGLDLQAAADNAEIWEKALRKLRGHLMPPPGSPQPAQKDVDSFVGWMESTLDTHRSEERRVGK